MSEISEKILQLQIFNNPNNKNLIVFQLESAFILLFRKQYDRVIEVTNEIINVEKNNYRAWLIRGNAYFFKKDLYNSEESYIKAIRYKPDNEKFNIKMLFRLGMTYIYRTTWIDAKTVFLKILKEEPGYSFAWGYLGLALMKLGEFQSAEEALNEANLLDIENMTIWAYLCIFCIILNRKNQALECLNELTKMQFQDVKLLEEIGDLFSKNGELNLTAEIYNRIIFINPNNLKIYFKLAGVYSQIESKKPEAIELLKNRMRNTDDENDKKKINKFLDYLNKEIGLSEKKDTNLYQAYDEEEDLEMGNDSLIDYI
jgi:tetratricopeptide (TPR) repeat protein